jgi:HD-like signal output (HDOD) protein
MARADTLQEVVEATRSIPCAPAILPQLLALTQSGDADSQEMATLILTDPGLAAGVLRLANSAYFGSTQRCDSISDAILRLGSMTLYRLAATIVAGRWLSYPTRSAYGWEVGDLCRHSLCVAIAAEVYARSNPVAEPETAYTAGLLHDVGKLALAFTNEEALEKVAELVPEPQPIWRNAEIAVLGYSSLDVTRELLRGWRFPPALVAVGHYHAQPSRAPEQHRPLVTLIHAAKNAATELGFGVGIDGFYADLDEEALREHGFDEEILQSGMPEVLTRVQRFIDADGRLKGIHSSSQPTNQPAPAPCS